MALEISSCFHFLYRRLRRKLWGSFGVTNVQRAVNKTDAEGVAKLSPRQRHCLERVALGETSSEIASRLKLSVRTVDQYIAEACLRLGVRRRTSAVARAMRLELIMLAPRDRHD